MKNDKLQENLIKVLIEGDQLQEDNIRELIKLDVNKFQQLIGQKLKVNSRIKRDTYDGKIYYIYSMNIDDVNYTVCRKALQQLGYICEGTYSPNYQRSFDFDSEWGYKEDNKNITYKIREIYDTLSRVINFIGSESLDIERDDVMKGIKEIQQKLLNETGYNFTLYDIGSAYPSLYSSDLNINLQIKKSRNGDFQLKFPYVGYMDNIEDIITLINAKAKKLKK